ncbi:ABC transporter permease [Candidatus Falkowbacteria bacterium]|nr:ABC transporter permease [Candidatus Falkowbacteria bacterium]
MKLKHTFNIALTGLRANKRRSFLTILGIVIGITAIILIMAIGSGAEGLIVGELGGLGAETIVIRPGKEPKGPTDFAETLFSDSLKQRELEAILKKSNVPDLIDAAPEVYVPGSVSYGDETYKPTIIGFEADFMTDALKLKLADGTLFDENDLKSKAKVAIIGSKVKDELFGDESPLGKNIQIKNIKFRVIGVYAPRGQVVFFNVDDLILLPHTTAQTYLSGKDYFHQLTARAKSPAVVNQTVEDIKRTLRELHNITDPEKDDFNVQTQQGLVQQVRVIINVFTAFLSFVVAISLVVGGIGVMNIMLVSVTERTREIGLRKAIGATNRDIQLQFLTEATLLTVAGGIISIILGSGLSLLFSFALSRAYELNWAFQFPILAAVLGIVVSGLIGLVFGLYPANQAAKKSPIEALRYE